MSARSTATKPTHAQGGLADGVVLTDAGCTVLGVDEAASRLLVANGLSIIGGRLTADSPHDRAALARLIATAMAGDGGEGAARLTQDDGHSLTIRVTRLRFIRSVTVESVAVIIICTSDSLTGMCKRYGLTTAETRLALELAAGHALRDAARHLGIRVNTARVQLRSIFAKTATNRQAALVRLLLANA